MKSEEKYSEECVIVFLDILGFKDMIEKNEEYKFLPTLEYFLRSFGSLTCKITENLPKSSGFSARPEISGYSDHMILSFPLSQVVLLKNKLAHNPAEGIISIIIYYVNRIFNTALANGLALRGAMHVGPLYHAGNLIFGRGLLEAYELERKAELPRIILSDSAESFIRHNSQHFDSYFKQEEQKYYLDNFSGTSIFAINGDQGHQNIITIKSKIEISIKCLQSNEDKSVLKKWKYLADSFNKALKYWRNSSPYYEEALSSTQPISIRNEGSDAYQS